MEKEISEFIQFSLADFYQNAGVVGLIRLLEFIDARKGQDYWLKEDCVLVKKEYLRSRDLAKDYIDVFNATYERGSSYGRVLRQLDHLIHLLEQEDDSKGRQKEINDGFKDIERVLTSASFKSGYVILENEGIHYEVIEQIKQQKKEKTADGLTALKDYLTRSEVRDVLCFKSAIYSVINEFWENKAFLLRANAQKNMKESFQEVFVDSLWGFLDTEVKHAKDYCIACGLPVKGKYRTSIAFIKDFADDLDKKKSAFWNCKVDAYICPLCAFLYSLAPLGFVRVGRDSVFVNCNDSVQKLSEYNREKKFEEESANQSWSRFYNEVVISLLTRQQMKINNIQVITRRRNEQDYRLSIIGKDVLQLLREGERPLSNLTKWASIKESKDSYINAYLETVANLIDHRNQYGLIYRLFKVTTEQPAVLGCVANVIRVQTEQTRSGKGENAMDKKQLYFAAKEGSSLRKAISGGDPKETDNKLRGLTLQLLNDLHVNNRRGFLEKLLRIYTSYNLPMPSVFTRNTGDDEEFLNLGYQFLLGLKGGFYEKKKEGE